MNLIRNIAFGCAFTLCAGTVGAQPDLKKLDAYFAKALADWEIPGMAVGIVKDGKLVFAKGYGVKEAGKNDKVDENTLFAIASNTKAFTTAALAMMVQERKLKWDDKVRVYLPYFELYDRYVTEEATITDLLCHRIGHRTFSGDAIWALSDDLSAEDMVRRARYLPKSYDFRAGFGYSNIMFITAGEVMKKADGKPWGEIIQSRILDRLGMNRTIYSSKHLASKGNFVTPHSMLDGRNQPIPWEDWEVIAPTGGIISSVNDMSKWMIFNLNNGVIGKDTLLTRQSRNKVWTVHNPFMVDNTDSDNDTHIRGYGLGWNLSDFRGRLQVSHGGGYTGILSQVCLIPDEKLGIVVMINGMKGELPNIVVRYALDAFLKSPEKDWSAEILKERARRAGSDKRIEDRKKARIMNTKPSLSIDKYPGIFLADIYGKIEVKKEGDALRMYFEHSKRLNATLEHWHYDVWKINFDQIDQQAWFSFATVKFDMDNNLKVTGLTFDVPNDDVWFEELIPIKVVK